jgi:lysyl endopeptidase
LLEEDRIEARNQKLPLRFAVPIDVNFNLTNSGAWYILPNGARLWRLKIVSPSAKLTSIVFSHYNLPTGAQLFIIGDADKQKYLGALTSENNKAHGRLATAPIEGESVTLEYYEPKEVIGKGKLSIQTIMHGYRNVFPTSEPMRDLSGHCNINVKCPLGGYYHDQVHSVAAITTGRFGRICSGAMIASADPNDKKQYFLTAAHCGTDTSDWSLVFNYESSTCPRGGKRTLDHTVSGLKVVAKNMETDFLLLEVEEKIPKEYNVYLSGWNALNDHEQHFACGIHHPMGDVKKVSCTYLPLLHGSFPGSFPGSHWKVQRWFNGTTERGSSGSALFDSQRRIVGQLTGGTADCSEPGGYDAFGKISASWKTGNKFQRLKDWLDPKNSGVMFIDGRYLYS